MSELSLHPQVAKLLALPQVAQRSKEWYELRRGRVTASEVAGILDIKPFASFSGSPRQEVLLRKAFPDDERYKFSGNIFTEHGIKYEDEARELYESRSGRKVLEFGLILHPDLPHFGASPDGITTCGRLVEIKCPLSRKIVPGECCAHYLPQCLFSMEVLNLEVCDFIQYQPLSITWPKPAVYDVTTIQRDREWFKRVSPNLDSFRAELLAGVSLPPVKAKRARTIKVPVCEIDSDDEELRVL